MVQDEGQFLGRGKALLCGLLLLLSTVMCAPDNSVNPRAPTEAAAPGARWEILWLARGSSSTLAQQFHLLQLLLCVHNTGFTLGCSRSSHSAPHREPQKQSPRPGCSLLAV